MVMMMVRSSQNHEKTKGLPWQIILANMEILSYTIAPRFTHFDGAQHIQNVVVVVVIIHM